MQLDSKPHNSTYRDEIYAGYLSRRTSAIHPETIEGLKSREPFINQIIRRHCPIDKGARILDLGCGHGAFVHILQKSGYHDVAGIDNSEEQIMWANQLGIKGVRHCDLRVALDEFAPDSLDVVIAFDILEHFTKEELLRVCRALQRVLKTGGRLIIHAPNGESPFASRILYWDFTHELAFTRHSIGQLLMSCGFSSVKCYEDRPVVHGFKSLVRRILWSVCRTGWRFYLAIETGSGSSDCILSQNFLTVSYK
jgi:SAM-dependent methyltransferase